MLQKLKDYLLSLGDMNIGRYGTRVEDANRYCHIYRNKYWYPACIHSIPLSAKGKTLPTFNYSLVTQQPETSWQELLQCSHFRGGGWKCLHLWAFWPTGTVWGHESLCLGSRTAFSVLQRRRECICLPQEFLGEQEENRLFAQSQQIMH